VKQSVCTRRHQAVSDDERLHSSMNSALNNNDAGRAPGNVSCRISDEGEEDIIQPNQLQSSGFANSLQQFEADDSYVDCDCKSKSNPPPTNGQQIQGFSKDQRLEDDMAIDQFACILRTLDSGMTPFGTRDSLVKASYMKQRRPSVVIRNSAAE
jgi:hypothetical protein